VEGDRSTGEHDEGEGCVGAVKASSAADDEAYDVVESLGASVVDVQPDRGEQALAELADRLGGLDERGQAGSAGPGDPPVDQLGDLLGPRSPAKIARNASFNVYARQTSPPRRLSLRKVAA
jgi:hypothetical protein